MIKANNIVLLYGDLWNYLEGRFYYRFFKKIGWQFRSLERVGQRFESWWDLISQFVIFVGLRDKVNRFETRRVGLFIFIPL